MQNNKQTLSCPMCNYTLFGYEPAIEIICNNCRKEKICQKQKTYTSKS